MKNNIVLIETYLSKGTGILYPCTYGSGGDYQSYLIFTCAHLFSDLENKPAENEDCRKYINVQIFDDDGEPVRKEEIEKLVCHIPHIENERFCDIAVLLVLVKKNHKFTLETRLHNRPVEDRSTVYLEGYPAVLLHDAINRKLQLRGIAKQMFPERAEIGMYQIEEEYHWYNDIKDKKLLDGFSGSPVYTITENQVSMIGMNQSVVNIQNGENPFKIMYYLKFQYILEILRKSNCILYMPRDDGSMEIEWVLDLAQGKEEKREITLLMLGDSGAGKSSFAQSFALHGENLLVTSDGQTTRTNIAYHFQLQNEKHNAKVHFYEKEQFIERMQEYNRTRKYNIFLREIGKMPNIRLDDSYEDFLRNAYRFLDGLGQSKHYKKVNDLKKAISNLLLAEEEDRNEDVIESVYVKVIRLFYTYFEMEWCAFLMDEAYIRNIYVNYRERKDSGSGMSYADVERNYIQKEIKNLNDEFGDDVVALIHPIFIENDKKNVNLQKYYEKLAERYETGGNKVNGNLDQEEIMRDKVGAEEFIAQYVAKLLKIEGFFDIKEYDVDHIDDIVQAVSSWYKTYREEEKTQYVGKLDLRKLNLEKDLSLMEEVIYGMIYDEITEHFEEEWSQAGLQRSESKETEAKKKESKFELDRSFELESISKQQKELLTKCLRVNRARSYTGIIRGVEIEDTLSDQYALMLKKLDVHRITLLDTCGLNHVENNQSDLNKVRNIITEYRDEGINFDEVAITYVKKLDAGRPDELRNMLPVLVRALPKAPIYCVFTGTDIYYGRNGSRMLHADWGQDYVSVLPKPVRFVLNLTPETILDDLRIRMERKQNLLDVLKNNVIGFCGDAELVQEDRAVYQSNLKNVRKLITSIALHEYAAYQMVDLPYVEQVLSDEKCVEATRELLKRIFVRASVKNWNSLHYRIVKADYCRIASGSKNDLGYYGACRHRWSQLFHDGYDDAVLGEAEEFLKCFEGYELAIEHALTSMADSYFLGDENLLFKKIIDGKEEQKIEKNEFRIIMEEMYQKQELYPYSPFEKEKQEKIEFSDVEADEKVKENLMEMFDFAKGLEDAEILERFRICFCDALKNVPCILVTSVMSKWHMFLHIRKINKSSNICII